MAVKTWIILSLSLFALLQKSKAQSLCRSDVDVVFMVDSSRSISSSDFNEAKKFVKQAAEEFGVAPGQSRAAVILFGESAKAVIGFGDAPTLEGFQKAVDGLKHLLGGHTRIDQALITAAKLFSNSKKKKVALLLTDGQQSRGFPDLKTASERLRNASVRVIAVGIGDKVDEPELKSITESEDDVILTKDYQDLKDKLLSIISRACDESGCVCTDDLSYITVKRYSNKKNREQDDIHFEFKTSQPSGTMMFVQGNVRDHIYVAYERGRELKYQVDLGKGEGHVVANNVKLNDNKWHEVRLNRVGRSITISIDNAHIEGDTKEIPGDFNRLDIKKAKAYFLGAPKSQNLLPNFSGCIRNFKVDGEPIIVHALRDDPDYSVSNRDHVKVCSENDQQ